MGAITTTAIHSRPCFLAQTATSLSRTAVLLGLTAITQASMTLKKDVVQLRPETERLLKLIEEIRPAGPIGHWQIQSIKPFTMNGTRVYRIKVQGRSKSTGRPSVSRREQPATELRTHPTHPVIGNEMLRLCCLLNILWLGLVVPAHAGDMNVVFILVDDWGATDAAVLGSDFFETPGH